MALEIIDFSGGLNTDDLAEELSSNQLLVAENLDLRGKGKVKGRFVEVPHSSYPETIDDIFFQSVFDDGGFIVRCSSNLYDGPILIKTDCPDTKHRFSEYRGFVIWSDGEKNWKYKRTGIKGGQAIGVTSGFEISLVNEAGLIVTINEDGYGCSFSWERQMVDGGTIEDGDRNCPTTGVDAALAEETLYLFSPVEIGISEYEGLSYEASYMYDWEEVYFEEGEDEFDYIFYESDFSSLLSWSFSDSFGPISHSTVVDPVEGVGLQTTFAGAGTSVISSASIPALISTKPIELEIRIDLSWLATNINNKLGITLNFTKQFDLSLYRDRLEVAIGYPPDVTSYYYYFSNLEYKLSTLRLVLHNPDTGGFSSLYQDGRAIVGVLDPYVPWADPGNGTFDLLLYSSSSATVKIYDVRFFAKQGRALDLVGLDYEKVTQTCSNPLYFQFPQVEVCNTWEWDLLSHFTTGGIGYCYAWELNLAKDVTFPGAYLGSLYLAQCVREYKWGWTILNWFMFDFEEKMLKGTGSNGGGTVDLCGGGKAIPYRSSKKGSIVQAGGSFWFEDDDNTLDGLCRYKVSFVSGEQRYGNAGFLGLAGGSGSYFSNLPLSSDPQITARWIWRTEPGLLVYRLCDIVENNWQTEWWDGQNRGIPTEELEINHVKPRVMTDWADHQSLLFALEAPNQLRWCLSYEDWEFFPELNYEPIGSDSRACSRILPLGQELEVYNDVEIWRYLGSVTDDFAKKLAMVNHRLAGPDCLASDGQLHMFVDKSGVFGFDSVRDISLQLPIDELWRENSEHDLSFEPSLVSSTQVFFLNGELFIGYAKKGETGLDTLLIVDAARKRAFTYDLGSFSNLVVDRLAQLLYYTEGKNIVQLANPPSTGLTTTSWTFTTKHFCAEFDSRYMTKAIRGLKAFGKPGEGTISILGYNEDGTKWFDKQMKGTTLFEKWRFTTIPNLHSCYFVISGTKDSEFYGLALDYATNVF